MEYKIDFRSRQPIYLQIVEQVRRKIESGELEVDDRLPAVRELAQHLGINFNTVARAYRVLDNAGLISMQRGRGTFIWKARPETTFQPSRQQELYDLTHRYLTNSTQLGFEFAEIERLVLQEIASWKKQAAS